MYAIAKYTELFSKIVRELDNDAFLVYVKATRIRCEGGLWNLETPMDTETSKVLSLVCKVWSESYGKLRIQMWELHKERVYANVKPIDLEATLPSNNIRFVNLDWAPSEYIRDFRCDLTTEEWSIDICEMEIENFFSDFEYSSVMDFSDW